MSEKLVNRIGWFAAIMSVAMYFSYIDQIRLNFAAEKGSFILPVITVVNCTAWGMYGLFKAKKDWPIIICNISGIFLGIVTAVTAVV
jgi:uncharacterized protein with PQ loop repeat